MANSRNRTPMDRVDKAWFEMDNETNLMVINGVVLFDAPIEFDELCAVFEERMVNQFPRFRERVVEIPAGSGRVFWEDDPYFDLRGHMLHLALPAPGDQATLQELVSDLCSRSLDRTRALWQVYLIDNVEGGCAVFARFHHCIGDGIALIQVMLSMTDTDAATSLHPVVNLPPDGAGRARRGLLRSTVRFAARTTQASAALAAGAVRTGFSLAQDPQQLVDFARASGIMSAASAAVLARLLLIAPDRDSVYRGELGVAKRAVWSEPIDLGRVKAIGRAAGATVNDVLIAALTGALRHDMLGRDDDPQKGDLRALVPVNLRDPQAELKLGNQFGLVFLSLPIGLDGPLERLYEVKRRMDVIKQSPEAVVAYQVLNLLGMLPGSLATWAVGLFAGKASAVLTNVPGPQQTLYMAGKPIQNMMFWVPQSGDIGVGISIISYDGRVLLGITIDAKLCDDPEPIVAAFAREFDLLSSVVQQNSRAAFTPSSNGPPMTADQNGTHDADESFSTSSPANE